MAEQAGPYAPDEVVRATVEAVNERGAKLAGIGWANYSRYGNVTPPEVGQEVEATLREGKTGGKWIQKLRALDANGNPAAPNGPFELGAGPEDDLDPATFGYDTPGRGSAAPRPIRQAAPAPAPRSGSKATLRAAALAAAAHFLSGKPESTEDDVYSTALRFVAFLEDGD